VLQPVLEFEKKENNGRQEKVKLREEIHSINFPPNITRVIKSGRLVQPGQAARVAEVPYWHKILAG